MTGPRQTLATAGYHRDIINFLNNDRRKFILVSKYMLSCLRNSIINSDFTLLPFNDMKLCKIMKNETTNDSPMTDLLQNNRYIYY